jgi:hypothetical protein
MGDVGAFLSHVLWYFWTVVAGFMIAVEPVIRFFWHGYISGPRNGYQPRRPTVPRATSLAPPNRRRACSPYFGSQEPADLRTT